MRFFDLTGQRFGNLIVLGLSGKGPWECLCDCGKKKCFIAAQLRSGNNKSCGCLGGEKRTRERHGCADHPLYGIWQGMINRCHYPTNKKYADYGGRGIFVCDQWRHSFSAFYAYVGDRPDGTWIERIDNNKGYEPGNVKWATIKEQIRNRRGNRYHDFRGEKLMLKDIHERFAPAEIGYYTLKSRIGKGWPIEKALTEPLLKNKNAA